MMLGLLVWADARRPQALSCRSVGEQELSGPHGTFCIHYVGKI